MNILQNQIQVALTALEMNLDPVIWRTKLRIQELMVMQNPTLTENIFITHLNHLFVLLIVGVSVGDFVLSTYGEISEERYEEGESEPILIGDIPQAKTYGTAVEFNERYYARGLLEGKLYPQIRHEIKNLGMSQQVAVIDNANEKGLIVNRVFYRRVDTPKNRTKTELPSLVVG
ncbi:hypothetical protein H7169_02695 [Candidatus Gracilibacteria bacterium]|nr:hypothetical protein [Candidatus Gracilibacteria bacterium]